MTRNATVFWTVSALGWILSGPAGAESVVNSKHNLSATGPGDIRARRETEICIFCHTPHNATSEAPLWNRYGSGAVYTPYGSSTTKARIGQPTGASKLCLSCHDGTLALGLVRSRNQEIEFSGGLFRMPAGPGLLGTDLSDDHPVSFRYDRALAKDNGELRDPGLLRDRVKLDARGELQCTACHDPHDNRYGQFLVRDNHASGLCMECHSIPAWSDSSHRQSSAGWNGRAPDPWPHTDETTVAANACENCHAPHSAGTHERLLNFANEEDNCNRCHNGNAAAGNVEAEFRKPSRHDVARTAGVHSPLEDLVNSPRHVECADCHNAHAAKSGPATASTPAGALTGVAGVSQQGRELRPIQHEYELCFRCHADSADRGRALVNRQYPETNTRHEFDQANTSFHPVTALGRNPDVPSLLDPYRPSSLIACTDCHNSDSGPGAGGNGPRGPHGSIYPPLLERRLVMEDGSSSDASTAALCYKCHSRESILSNDSFPAHRQHVDAGESCVTCHDPHGSRQPHLINFNPDYAKPLNGALQFVDTGRFSGTCTLTCHGKDHDNQSYLPGQVDFNAPPLGPALPTP